MRRLYILCLLVIGISQKSVSQTKDTTTWNVLLGKKKVGFQKIWSTDGKVWTCWYQWNDRGRGDSTVAKFSYNAQGFIDFIDGRGVDYYKKPIYEKFQNSNGYARWENPIEKEERKIDGNVSYVASISVGSRYGNYFNSPSKTIKLLPSGESVLTVLKEHRLKDGTLVKLISLAGTGLTPTYLWIDGYNEFFAVAGDWFALIRAGYEWCNDELTLIQQTVQQERNAALKKKLAQPISNLIIKNATMFESRTGRVREHVTIVIKAGVVREITSTAPKMPLEGFKTIDASGKFVMPGLWDNHVHYAASQGLLHMACGVTNIRDMGSGLSLLRLKREIDNGQVIGPRIQVMCGFIDGPGQYSLPLGKTADTPEEGLKAVRYFADSGYQQIKLYSSLRPELVKPIAAEAKRLGLRVSGHIPSGMVAEEAIRDGFDEIQHVNMLFLNFYGKEIDTRTPARFAEVAKRAGSFNFESTEFKAFVNLLKTHHTVVDPTLSIFEDTFLGTVQGTRPSSIHYASRLPIGNQRILKRSKFPIPPGLESQYKKSFDSSIEMVKALYKSGITIIPGTDDFAGFTLHRELENYVRCGIPNNEVLTMATWTSAQVNRKSDKYGSIEVGKPADLIIINGNPLLNILDLQKIETVVQESTVYQAADLLKAVSIKNYNE